MRLSLAGRISLAIVGVLALAMLSSIVTIGSAYRFETFHSTLVAENLESVQAAEELEIALLEQRGHVSSYILDEGNTTWLHQLESKEKEFEVWLARARKAARSDKERDVLDELEQVHGEYAELRDVVVTLYDSGQVEEARMILLGDVVKSYQRAFDLCEEFISENRLLVDSTTKSIRGEVELITITVTLLFCFTIALSIALLWLFFRGVLIPLRRISADVRGATGGEVGVPAMAGADELRDLRHYAQLLMEDVAESRFDLEQSRTQLAHADKLAAVGKLAASVAHEIRNPLTSMKMWLYSLRRTVAQNGEVQQKFDVIADELSRLERIIRDFLEFSRPPRLHLEPQPVDALLEKTIELTRLRLADARITLYCSFDAELPPVMADADQLRQVFLNLINNAVEAMPDGGEIQISSEGALHRGRSMVAMHVVDSGPGIPPDVRKRLFEPFFSTKDEGSGLGLCIAASVMARHHGLLVLDSSTSCGTQWTVWIPTADSPSSTD